ncbi:MAG: 50S ribosomal protein L25/general stress protein Ctc [Alphaproteobacteria bacterium]|nr:50S ribosomal protein L25/general stress protein Ctc [Alphaproteobacteria bacterium]
MAGIVLSVDRREQVGTGSARARRREGLVPGVLYGGARGSVAIEVKATDLKKALRSGKFISHLITLDHKGEKQPVIPKAIQYHPVTEEPVHLDLYRVEENSIIEIGVPVHLKGQDVSPGLKRGGALTLVEHVLRLRVPAGNIPEEIVIDVSALDIGAVVHLSAIELPAGAKPAQRGDATILTITGRNADKSAPAPEPAAAAPAAPAKKGDKK